MFEKLRVPVMLSKIAVRAQEMQERGVPAGNAYVQLNQQVNDLCVNLGQSRQDIDSKYPAIAKLSMLAEPANSTVVKVIQALVIGFVFALVVGAAIGIFGAYVHGIYHFFVE